MKLSDIKRGDILVAYYPEITTMTHKRNHIIFIASGEVDKKNYMSNKVASIGVIAAINLAGNFKAIKYENEYMTIGFTIWSNDNNKITILRKPTFYELTELIAKMKIHNLMYNRKTKTIKIKYD